MFLNPWFAIAGLALAAGPILIHLLNRRRYRLVDWAAMDFLIHAVRRRSRMIRLRDLILLALRVGCVVLFALAMARPYFSSTDSRPHPDQPVHAVLIVDNSQSMGYESLDGTLLESAKKRAREFIQQLPHGSRISVLPLCGSQVEHSIAAYRTTEDAVEALGAIRVTDRQAGVSAALDMAIESCRRTTSPPSKQIVLLSDQQTSNWPTESPRTKLDKLPSPLQVVHVSAPVVENAWVSDFRLQDDVADLGSPAVFLAEIRYMGSAPRHGVQVTLTVDGMTIATQSIELQPGQSRQVQFPPYLFEVPTEPGHPTFVQAEVSIPQDALPTDNQRFLVVPVVDALPVVFVDEYGEDEDPGRNRFGQTYRLRRLMAPITERKAQSRQLIQVRHIRIDRLGPEPTGQARSLLEDARLIVIAGVADPAIAVPILRSYVEQGGSLVIAPGGDFNPIAWTESAWLEGRGILPAPLNPTLIGSTIGSSTKPLDPFQLDFESMFHEYFLIEQTSRTELEDLYQLPYFFQAIKADLNNAALDILLDTETQRITEKRITLERIDQRLAELAHARMTDIERTEQARLQAERMAIDPHWLLAAPPAELASLERLSAEDRAKRSRPRVLATYTNGVPFLIERNIGRGRVLFFSSGVYRDWNTMTATNAVLLFDRIFRRLIRETLPDRNLSTTDRLVLPVTAEERHARFVLTDPLGNQTPLSVDALGANRYGVVVARRSQRGHYRVAAYGNRHLNASGSQARLRDVPLALNGPVDESQLDFVDAERLQSLLGDAPYRWVGADESISLTGATIHGQDYWKWLMAFVLMGLLVELAVLAAPFLPGRRST